MHNAHMSLLAHPCETGNHVEHCRLRDALCEHGPKPLVDAKELLDDSSEVLKPNMTGRSSDCTREDVPLFVWRRTALQILYLKL